MAGNSLTIYNPKTTNKVMSDDNRRKRNLGVCIPDELQEALKKLASQHGWPKSTYATAAVCDAILKGRKFTTIAVEVLDKKVENVSPTEPS